MAQGLEAGRPSESERLRRIESVTDTALADLGVEDLLTELLERVREMLDTDTATVLLVDDDTGELVTTAVSGTDEDIRLGLRLAPGEGFAGRVAVEGRPVIIDDVATSELRSSTLRSRGLRTLLGVPLLAGSQVTGVLHIGSTRPRRFGPDDVHLLRLVAERAALAIETRRANVERAAAAALARSFIPSRPPAVPGLDISGRYLPAGEGGVGGDWYDILPLPSARVGIAIGDVVGRGLPAAVVMGRLRSALRAYALESSDPAEVLVRLDRKLQHFEAGQMTTVLYGVFDPSLQTIAVSSAGHPLPMAVTEHGEACSLDVPVDPPLGVAPALARRVTTVDVPLGSALVLFTDGLVERRDEPLDHGLKRLQGALRWGSAEECCSRALSALLDHAPLNDDAALLVVRREDERGRPLHLEVPARPASLARMRTVLRRWLPAAGVDEDRAIDVLLAVGEAAANSVRHAYGTQQGTIGIDAALDGPDLVVVVRDRGRWRAPEDDVGGRGLQIMERTTDRLDIRPSGEGTEVRLCFRVAGSTAATG